MHARRTAATLVLVTALHVANLSIRADTLWRKDQQISLERSTEYVAIRLKPHVPATDEALRRAALPGTVIDQTPTLVEHNMVLVRQLGRPTDPVNLSEFGKLEPVYKANGAYVVITNEVIVKIPVEAQHLALPVLSTFGKIKALNDRGTFLLTVPDSSNALSVSNSLNENLRQIEFAEPNFVSISRPVDSPVSVKGKP